MQIKKFVAPSLKAAIAQMKSELGEESIVLSTRVLKGEPRYGIIKKFEITAGVEDDYDSGSSGKVKNSDNHKLNFESELKKLTEKIYKRSNLNIDELSTNTSKTKQKVFPKIQKKINETSKLLLQRDVNPKIVDTIIKQLKNYSQFLTDNNIENYIISTISSMIPTSTFEINKRKGPKVLALVGPTGVGKTTCIAKLSVISKILHNLDVGLISIDTYRIGALDQLKIFSDISSIDFKVAYEPSDMRKLITEFNKKDIVFIDTVGRSQNRAELLQGIKDFLKPIKVDEIYLVLSTTSAFKNMFDTANKFKTIGYDSFVFTKLDEAVTYGSILNLVTETNIPIKYFTNGQVIPDDIIAADSEFTANMIYTGALTQ